MAEVPAPPPLEGMEEQPLLHRVQVWLAHNLHLSRMSLPLCMMLWTGAVAWRVAAGPGGLVGGLDTEEAVVGLMARHVANGGLPSVFVWGSSRMAALEPIPAGALFALDGESMAALRMAPFLAWMLASLYALMMVGRWLGARPALAAALLGAVAFPGPGTVLARSLGGFGAGVLNGMLAMGAGAYLSVYRPRRLAFSTGLFIGLCLFTHPGTWPFALGGAVAAVQGLLVVLKQPGRFLAAANHAFRLVVGLVVGTAPLLLGRGFGAFLPDTLGGREFLPDGSATAFLPVALGSGLAPSLVVLLGVLGVAGVVVRLGRFGLDDAGARLGTAALVTCVAAAWAALRVAPHSQVDGALRLVPAMMCLPLLAAAACEVKRAIPLVLTACLALLLAVDPAAVPPSGELGADLPVEPVMEWLDQHPGTHCYTTANVAYRVAFESHEKHRCVAITGPDHTRAWRADAAGGERAYFLTPEETRLAKLLEQDLGLMRRRFSRDVAGPFLVRVTAGIPYPPVIPPVVWEHAKREKRAAIDADVDTGVQVKTGDTMRMELVWPTFVTSLSYWQDVTRLQAMPCSVRGGATVGGKDVAGPVTHLRRECDVARRWALWPHPTWELKVALPQGVEAASVYLENLDSKGVIAMTEVRVTPKELRKRVEK